MKHSKYLITMLAALSILFSCKFVDDNANKIIIKEHNILATDEDKVVVEENKNHENEINSIQLAQVPENTNISTKNTEDTSKQAIQQKEDIEVSTAHLTQNLPMDEDGNMIRLINETRATNGLDQLTYDPTLYSVADIRLNEISTYFSHTRPDGSNFYTASIAIDGENISKFGAGDASSSFEGFMDSAGHRANILYRGFNRVACKKAVIDETVYWIQLFGY